MIIILYIIVGLIVMFELINIVVYGSFVPKHIAESFYPKEYTLRLNPYNNGILSANPYVSKLTTSILAKYYIDGFGLVPRWSKLHKRINRYYAIALKNSLEQ